MRVGGMNKIGWGIITGWRMMKGGGDVKLYFLLR